MTGQILAPRDLPSARNANSLARRNSELPEDTNIEPTGRGLQSSTQRLVNAMVSGCLEQDLRRLARQHIHLNSRPLPQIATWRLTGNQPNARVIVLLRNIVGLQIAIELRKHRMLRARGHV